MILSASSLNRRVAALLLGLAVLAGCGGGKEALMPAPPGAKEELRIAVLPVENLSGTGGTPAKQLRQALLERLKGAGFTLLEDDRLDQFMARHRIRNVGGVDTATARAFLEETGTKAVMITNLALDSEAAPPRISLFCRLVSTGDRPEILWMDGVGMAGDDSPGILDLGLIEKPQLLRDKALRFLVGSLSKRLAGKSGRSSADSRAKTFRPKLTFSAPFLQKGKRYTVGVVPFSNESVRNHAGEIMALHFVRELSAMDDFIVLEPGVVRERLLGLRIIMEQGISLNDLYVMSNSLGTDLLLTGRVARYEDPNAPMAVPRVDFSVLLMEGAGKKIIWASKSYNQGDDSVFFFDVGRIGTAFETAAKMVHSLLGQVDRRSEAPVKAVPAETDFFKWFWRQQ